ncbi:MAG TPA: hypothetical protein VER33_11645 [Polyangiaceae bacterium]|nr:hypothetical protein [Polyangiaceae bacterium]
MTQVSAARAPAAVQPGALTATPAPTLPLGLPEPTLPPLAAQDALVLLLVSAQKMAESSMELTQNRLDQTREALRAQTDELLEQIRKQLEALEKEKDGGGLFGSILKVVCKAFGALAEGLYDAAKLQVDLVATTVKDFGNMAALLKTLESGAQSLVETGKVGNGIAGFSEGVTRFGCDCAVFVAKLHGELAKAAVTGELELKDDLISLAQSYKANIGDNPEFWEAMSLAAKGAAVVMAVGSGGTLAIASVALLVIIEADARTNFIEAAFGETAAPYIRGGLQLTALVATMYQPASAASAFNVLTSTVNTASAVNSALLGVANAEEEAAGLERAASFQQQSNSIARLQRLIEQLIGTLGDEAEDERTSVELGRGLLSTRAATEQAAVFA